MSRVVRIQTNFASGAIDPLLRSRVDLNQYYNGLQTAENVTVMPQGGLRRRDGLRYISEIPAAGSPGNGVKLVPFEFSADDSYMLALCQQRIYIFRNQALVTNINGSGNDYLAVSQIVATRLSKMRYAQNADTIIFVHEDMAPLKIVRGASHSTWTASNITFTNAPTHAFTLATSNPSATLTPSGTTGNIELTAGSGVFTSAHEKQYININSLFGRVRIIEFVSSTKVKGFCEIDLFDTTAVAASDWELETGYEDSWSGTRGYPVSVTFHEGRLYFGGSKSEPTTFWGSNVNQFFDFQFGEGLDDQTVSASITTASLNQIVDIFSGRDLQIFTTGGEFFIPQTIGEPITPSNLTVKVATRNGAKPGVPVAGLDSGTLFIQRQGKQLNELLFSDAELAYTTSAISLLSGHLLKTPVDMAIRRATSTEEADRLFIVNSDAGTISVFSLLRAQQVVAPSEFITDGEFLAIGIDVDTAYVIVKRALPTQATATITVTDAANIAAGSTITITDNAGTSTTMTATTDDPAGALFFSVGGGRGNNTVADNISVGHGGSLGINALAGYSAPNPAANVITVTRAEPGANNLTITSSDPTRLTCTNFTGGTADKYYVEYFDSTLHTDSGVYSASASATGAATHLENVTLDVIVDGNVQTDKTVSSGSVTFDRASTANYEIGIPYTMSVVTMPVEPRLQSGNLKGFKKRILEVNAEVFESQAMTVNGQLVAFRQFGTSALDTSVQAFTGVKKVGPLLGYTNEGTITVSQTVPLDLTLLALDYKISVGA